MFDVSNPFFQEVPNVVEDGNVGQVDKKSRNISPKNLVTFEICYLATNVWVRGLCMVGN